MISKIIIEDGFTYAKMKPMFPLRKLEKIIIRDLILLEKKGYFLEINEIKKSEEPKSYRFQKPGKIYFEVFDEIEEIELMSVYPNIPQGYGASFFAYLFSKWPGYTIRMYSRRKRALGMWLKLGRYRGFEGIINYNPFFDMYCIQVKMPKLNFKKIPQAWIWKK